MTKFNISKRLLKIASLVDKNSFIIDVGCDHALLDIYLSSNNIIKGAIASDITMGALNQAKANIKKFDAKNIETRLGDGLNTIKESDLIDTIILAGMGNNKIISILNERIDVLNKVKSIIIQTNMDSYFIRKEMVKLGFFVEDETLVKERGIIYVIMKFNKMKKNYSEKELYFGPILLKKKEELFYEMINNNINTNNKIIKSLPNKMILKKLSLKMINSKLKKEIR